MFFSTLFTETAIRALLAQPDSDDEDGDEEENDEVDFPVHYALLSTPPPRLTSQSTPHPHIKHNTTSEFLMSNIQTWTAWEKESLDYGGAQARFIHDLCFGECGAHGHAGEDEDEDGKSGEGVDSLFAGLSALD